jgi:hypothetical protein
MQEQFSQSAYIHVIKFSFSPGNQSFKVSTNLGERPVYPGELHETLREMS